MRVLFVEDSVRLRNTVVVGLRKAGYAVDATGDGDEGLWYAQSRVYDVIVLDWMLPGLDGCEILRRLRQEGDESPVLFLTAKDAVADRVFGLRAGADDYLVKPFAFEEFLARVGVLARRQFGLHSSRIPIGDLVIDTGAKTVSRQGRRIELTAREYRLLEYLALRRGVVVSRTEIEAHIYADETGPTSNVVDAIVYSLRRKDQGLRALLRTRRGLGYVLDAAPA